MISYGKPRTSHKIGYCKRVSNFRETAVENDTQTMSKIL